MVSLGLVHGGFGEFLMPDGGDDELLLDRLCFHDWGLFSAKGGLFLLNLIGI